MTTQPVHHSVELRQITSQQHGETGLRYSAGSRSILIRVKSRCTQALVVFTRLLFALNLLIDGAHTVVMAEGNAFHFEGISVDSFHTSEEEVLSIRLVDRLQVIDCFELESPDRIVVDFKSSVRNDTTPADHAFPRRAVAPFPKAPVIRQLRYAQHKEFQRLVFDVEQKPVAIELKESGEISVSFKRSAHSELQTSSVGPDPQDAPDPESKPSEVSISTMRSSTYKTGPSNQRETGLSHSWKAPVSISPSFITLQPPLQPIGDILVRTSVPGIRYSVTLRPLTQTALTTNTEVSVSPRSIDLSQVGSLAESKIRFALLKKNEVDFDQIYGVEVRATWSENEAVLTPGFLSVRPLLENPSFEWKVSDGRVMVRNRGNISAWACLALNLDAEDEECSLAGEGVLVEPGQQRLLSIPEKMPGELRLIYGDRVEKFPL